MFYIGILTGTLITGAIAIIFQIYTVAKAYELGANDQITLYETLQKIRQETQLTQLEPLKAEDYIV